jgi:uncharacterized protein (DUF2267 family)
MKTNEFVRQVQEASGLSSREKAEEWSLAVLDALADLIPTSEARRQFTTQLPGSFKAHLVAGTLRGLEMDHEAFVQRVGAALGVHASEAARVVRAVYGVVARAIAPGELRDFEDVIPSDVAAFLRKAT